jgi:hypothetical protein
MRNSTVPVQGWTEEPPGRGSLNIIWTCLLTISLCSWSAVCTNIPSINDPTWKPIRTKAWLTLICLIGPEYLLVIALGQWTAARQAFKDARKQGLDGFTRKHAWYAEMGGYTLQTADGGRYSLRTRSLLWLKQEGILTANDIKDRILMDVKKINDRNKTDSFIRVLALGQTAWFFVDCMGRVALDLPLTTLELTVLGFLAPTITTYTLWWHKPCDVSIGDTIHVSWTLPQILERRGPQAHKKWHITPFDFLDRDEWHGSILLRYWLNILAKLCPGLDDPGMPAPAPRARDYVSDNDLLPLTTKYLFVLEVLPTLPFLGVNFAAWNSHFPTHTERTLWRIASFGMALCFFCGGVVEAVYPLLWTRAEEIDKVNAHREVLRNLEDEYGTRKARRVNNSNSNIQASTNSGTRFRSWLSEQHLLAQIWCRKRLLALRNNSDDKDENLDVPLRMLVPATIAASCYVICRLYIVVEDFIAFREMPSAVYDSVEWLLLLPHWG